MSIEPEYALWTSTRTRKIFAIGICMVKCSHLDKNNVYNGYACEQKFAKSNKICFGDII